MNAVSRCYWRYTRSQKTCYQ